MLRIRGAFNAFKFEETSSFILNNNSDRIDAVVVYDDDKGGDDDVVLISKNKKRIIHEIIGLNVMKFNSVWPHGFTVLKKSLYLNKGV